MSTFLVTLATVALLILINGLYVAAEFATVAARRTRISQLAASGNKLARQLLRILEDGVKLDNYVAACQLGITASSLVLGAYGQRVVAPQLEVPLRSLLGQFGATELSTVAAQSLSATGILLLFTILQVILGELFPKSVAVQYPEQMSLGVMVPMRWSLVLFRPLIWLFNGSANVILRLLGLHQADGHGSGAHSPQEIEILVTESHEGGLLNRDEQQMLRNAFRLRELTARQVMVHRTRLVAAPVDSTVEHLLALAIEAGNSRVPLYQDSIDNILGFVHIKDVYRLYVHAKQNLLEIMRQVVRVPEMLPLVDVWETLQNKRQYMAIVFDEYGGTAGMITFEDVIEEIFGELQDEFDDEMAIMSQSDGRIHLRGDVLVSDVNEYFELTLPEDVAVTLSGLVISQLGRAPEVGDVVALGGSELRVEELEDLGVAEVSLPLAPTAEITEVAEWEVGEDE